jgi:hypothetical protein
MLAAVNGNFAGFMGAIDVYRHKPYATAPVTGRADRPLSC